MEKQWNEVKIGDFIYHYVYLQSKNIVRKTKYIVTQLVDNRKFSKNHQEDLVIYAKEVVKGHEEYYKVVESAYSSDKFVLYCKTTKIPGRIARISSNNIKPKLTQIWLTEENDYYADQQIMFDLRYMVTKAEQELKNRKDILQNYNGRMINKYARK